MSKELKWCKEFNKVMNLRSWHKKRKVRIKNLHRSYKLLDEAIKKWKGIPYPQEWKPIRT